MQGVRHWAAIFPRTRNARARMSDTLSLHSTSPSSSLLSRALNFPSVLRSMSSCNFSSASDGRRSSAIASIRSRGGLDGGAHGLSFLCSGLVFSILAEHKDTKRARRSRRFFAALPSRSLFEERAPSQIQGGSQVGGRAVRDHKGGVCARNTLARRGLGRAAVLANRF